MPDQISHCLKRIKQLFDTCVVLDGGDREALLGDPSHDRDEVEEVRRLLAIADCESAAEHQTDIIGRQLQELSQSVTRGQQLGVYQVEREIGRGGMGIVFLAHRVDGSYQQQVAIKIAPSFASEEELRHFHQERQILARLQHSNIAMLLDGGATAEQRPYLVMEHIEGTAITDYCDKQQLDLLARLSLFLAVCDAVSFAHSRLVIHRDIKPENVLVTAEGQVKLLDFGISKILHSEQKSTHTTRLMGLTPACASPEQIRGEATTTATDIYGLGTLLYKLLSGESPHPGGEASTEQIIRAICEQEPTLVSKAASENSTFIIGQILRGDIDNIVAKTLRKEPQNRYASVSGLQQDIERFLRGEAVLATPPGLIYRGRKFVRRYPVASLLAVSVFVAISGGLAASLHLASALRGERDNLLTAQKEIEKQAHTAQRTSQLLMDMFSAASPENARGRTVDVDELLEISVEKTRGSLNEEPQVKAQLLKTLASVKFSTGKYKDAAELQREAISIDSAKLATAPQSEAEDLATLGQYLRFADQMESAREALSEASNILKEHPDKRTEALVLMRQGQLMLDLGKPRLGIRLLSAAQEYWQDKPDKGGELGASSQHSLAVAYFDIADFPTATRLEELVLYKRTKMFGDAHPQTLASHFYLAKCYMRISKWPEARKQLEYAYKVGQKIFSEDNGTYRDIASHYARLMRRLGYHQLAIDILSKLLSTDAQSEGSTAQLLNHRGYTYFEMGMYERSRSDLEQANEILSRIYPDDSSASFLTRINLGEALATTGDLNKGVTLLESTLKSNIKQFGESDYGTAAIYLKLARIAFLQKQFAKAYSYLNLSRKINLNNFDRNNPILLEVDEVEAMAALNQGNHQKAKKLYQDLISRSLKAFPEDAPILAKFRATLSKLQ